MVGKYGSFYRGLISDMNVSDLVLNGGLKTNFNVLLCLMSIFKMKTSDNISFFCN